MNYKTLLLSFAFAAITGLAGDQTWCASPTSANWNKTDLNWDEGAAWTDNSTAVFGESSTKAITVKEKVTANGMKIQSDGYTFAGPATDTGKGLVLASATPTNQEQVDIPVEVAAGVSATFNTFVKMFAIDAFYKKGDGKVTLGSGCSGLQLIVNGGDLHLTGGRVFTAKIYKNPANVTANLHLDNVLLEPWNANKLIGHPNRFNSATIGEHGFTISNTTYDVELHQCFSTAPNVVTDGGITKKGDKQLLIAPQGGEKSTFAGGFTVNAGELAVANADGLGTGAVVVKSGAGVSLQDAAFGQAHAYNLDNGGYLGAIGSNFTVGRPGELPAFASSNFRNVLGLGRVGTRASTMTFVPTNDVRLGGVNLSGALDLTLGGTIKVNEQVGNRIFRTENMTSGSSVQVAMAGLAVDVPAGVATDFGLPLAMRKTNVIQESTTVDDFEVDKSGWTLAKNGSADGDPARSNNGGSYIKDEAYYTPDGTYFAYLRRKNYMEKSITVPSAGRWRVAFQAGCRPGYDSYKLTMTVKLGDNSYTIPAREANHGFREFVTPTYELMAGAKTVRITLSDGQQWSGMGIDRVRLERVGDVDVPFTKTGAGELAVSGFTSAGAVAVSAGTLAFADAALANAQVTVANGATLALGRVTLDGAQVTVPAGATLALRPAGTNLIKNGSFEEPGGTSATAWQHACTGWTATKLSGRSASTNSGGQNNGSTVSSGATAYRTPYGCTTAYIRSQYQMSQSVSVPADGKYVLSFVHSQRVYDQDPAWKNPISVEIDGVEVVNIPARTGYVDFTRVTTAPISLTAGAHTLAFKNNGTVGSPDGAMVFIDDVSLTQKAIDIAFANDARIDLVTGSVVRLDNGEKIELDMGLIYVNGEPFNGTRSTLRTMGVVVEGDGKIQVGPKLGLSVIVR